MRCLEGTYAHIKYVFKSYHTRLIPILAKRDYKDGKTLSYNIVAFLEIEQILIIFYLFYLFSKYYMKQKKLYMNNLK